MSSDDAGKSSATAFSQVSGSALNDLESTEPSTLAEVALPAADISQSHLLNGFANASGGLEGHEKQADSDVGIHEAGTSGEGKSGSTGFDGGEGDSDGSVAELSEGLAGSAANNEDGAEWMTDGDHESKRVKVYELIGSRWEDQGTAFCFGQFNDDTNEALLLARAEVDFNKIILTTTIRSNDVYQRQQDTLIVWTEPDGVDYALSFQDPEGCLEVWNFILEVQRHMNSGDDPATVDSSSPLIGPEPSLTTANIIRSGHLPQPQLGIIGEIERAIKTLARTQSVKERICEYIQQEEYIKSLIDVMHQAEDLESINNLHALCSCMQTILMMNNHGMYEHILDDDIFFGVVGMLEYDPEFPTYKANYRDFLRETAHFHQPILIHDDNIQRKIHHTYRLQFLKDVVLARALDDSTFNVLNSCILFNQIDIITHVQHDPTFLRQIVGLYVDDDMLSGGGNRKKDKEAEAAPKPVENSMEVDQTSSHDAKPNGVVTLDPQFGDSATDASRDTSAETVALRREVVLLIQQLCAMGKNVQLPARMALFRALVDRGILFAVQWALSLQEQDAHWRAMVSAAGEVLGALLDHDLNGVRGHVLKQVTAIEKEREAGKKGAEKAETILVLMCRMMASSRDMAVQSQLGDALKLLLEIPSSDGPEAPAISATKMPPRGKDDPGTERFMDYFYKNCIDILLKPLRDMPEHKSLTEPVLVLTREKANLLVYLCEFICNFALQHTFRSHFYMLSSCVAPRIASLLRCRDKHLRLAAFRFFRACIKLNNRNFIAHLVKHDVFKPIITLTVQESKRDNLLSATCLEFFEYLRRENMKDLIAHCMEVGGDEIKQLSETPLNGHRFILFIRRWEMNNQPVPIEQTDKPTPDTRNIPGSVAQRMEAEAIEDDYFTRDDSTSDEEEFPQLIKFRPSQLLVGPPSPPPGPLQKPTRRKRQILDAANAAARARPPHLLNTPPRTPPPLGALVDYEDEEDIGVVGLAGQANAASTSKAGGSKATEIGPSTNIRVVSKPADLPPRRLSDEDEEDNILESLFRGKKLGPSVAITSGPPSPSLQVPPSMGKRRRNAEEDDEDEMERLANRGKRPDLGGSSTTGGNSSASAGGTTGPATNSPKPAVSANLDGPKKIMLKLGSIGLGGGISDKGAKDGDTG